VPVRGAALLAALLASLAAAPAAAADEAWPTYSHGRCAPGHTVLAPAGAAGIALPRLTGRVVDNAGIVSPKGRAALAARLARLEAKTSDQLVVVTVPDLRGRPIEAYGIALGNGWGIGRKHLGNGVLLIVAPNEHKVRIEIGCGLEGLLTPPRAAAIVRDSLLPLLKARRYDAAAEAGVRCIAAVLESDVRRPQRSKETSR
jgi:uncharacterized protein